MAAAERHGYRWPTMCHGQAICTACAFVLEVDSSDAFEPPEPVELKGLETFAGRTYYENKYIRLACQARPVSSTVVTKRGVHPRRG